MRRVCCSTCGSLFLTPKPGQRPCLCSVCEIAPNKPTSTSTTGPASSKPKPNPKSSKE